MSETSTATATADNGHVRNVLFVMCDQLRWDVIAGAHASAPAGANTSAGTGSLGGLIDTPNINRLAERGVRFDQAYIQGSVCGSSRMSYYTGRYVQSHGARYNRIPLAIGQKTLGDHLRPLGVRTVLIGKTHYAEDRDGMARLGLDPDDPNMAYIMECGFEGSERDDGLHPIDGAAIDLPYNRFLREHGYGGENPWHSAANSVIGENGQPVSGWLLRSSAYPAIVADELSETAYLTDRAIAFMTDAADSRWCAHLSFIKPHWPYVVSDPYHNLVAAADVPPAQRSAIEIDATQAHPVLDAFRSCRIGQTFSRNEVRDTVVPAYLGLVKQIDDHLGRLLAAMDRLGRLDDTMIVFTSDHGDYLGDHFMGEKDWFHEQIVRVPMIVVDPRRGADSTRGTVSNELVEAIDLTPTFVEALGGDLADTGPWLEGRSLVPMLHRPHRGPVAINAEPGRQKPREVVFCESDFGFLELSATLPPTDRLRSRRATMIRSEGHKYILCETGSNLLYDLDADPDEYHNRIDDPALAAVQAELHERLFEWFRHRSHDISYNDAHISVRSQIGHVARGGVFIGYWDESDLPTP